MKILNTKLISGFENYLIEEEKSSKTVEKYIRDIKALMVFAEEKTLNKALMLEYKERLIRTYAPASANAAISSVNCFLSFMGWYELRLKTLKIQKQIFASEKKVLTKAEYTRLLCAAKRKKNTRLYYLMQTICASGIRVSELRFITLEAVKAGQANISCKGKMRVVILPKQLCGMLKKYAKERGIKGGSIFVTRSGNPLDRSNIWLDMKKLCQDAGVDKEKVFPHNLRHLFARTYYSVRHDIVRLADILGHSSINTARIYTVESGDIHRKQIQQLGLLRC